MALKEWSKTFITLLMTEGRRLFLCLSGIDAEGNVLAHEEPDLTTTDDLNLDLRVKEKQMLNKPPEPKESESWH